MIISELYDHLATGAWMIKTSLHLISISEQIGFYFLTKMSDANENMTKMY